MLYRFRYYHLETGRYISEDPIKLLGGFNVFAYVSDSNAWVDLLGLNSYRDTAKTLNEWLKDNPELLKEVTDYYKKFPEWWGIDPNSDLVFYRTKNEVDEIRKLSGESGGHHPWGLALGSPIGQDLTITNETRTNKNPTHSKVTGLQKRVINVIKKQILNGK